MALSLMTLISRVRCSELGVFDGPRLGWLIGETKGYAKQTFVVPKSLSHLLIGVGDQLNSSVNTDGFIQRLISARSQLCMADMLLITSDKITAGRPIAD